MSGPLCAIKSAAGTATALEASDVAIMDDDPRKIATFVRLSHRTSAVLKQNILLALGISHLKLLTNSPKPKVIGIEGYGLSIDETRGY